MFIHQFLINMFYTEMNKSIDGEEWLIFSIYSQGQGHQKELFFYYNMIENPCTVVI